MKKWEQYLLKIFLCACLCLRPFLPRFLKHSIRISVSDKSKHDRKKKEKKDCVTHINESINMCVMNAGSISQAATCPDQNPVSLLPSIMSQQ